MFIKNLGNSVRSESLRRLGITPSGGVIEYAVACKIYTKGWYDEKNTPSGKLLPGPDEPLWTRRFTEEKTLQIYQSGSRDYAMKRARTNGKANTYSGKFLNNTEPGDDE